MGDIVVATGKPKEGGTSIQCSLHSATNYTVWAVRMKITLKVHKAWEDKETETLDTEKNNLAMALLFQSILESLVLQVGEFDTANQVWEDIKTRHVGAELLGSKTVISKSTAKIIILANSSRKTSRKKDRKNTNTYGRGSPERSVRKETGQDPRTGPFSLVRLAHGRGRPSPRSPRPWARTTSTTVTSPVGEDGQHHGHLAHGRGRPRPWARTTITKVTSPMGEDDHHQGHLANGRGRPAPWSPRPWARTIRALFTSP